MPNYDSIDLAWSWDGDLAIDDNGDIKDTQSNYLLALADTIQAVVKSESFDWEKDPLLGANLSDFQGEPNTRDVGKAIEDQIKIALTSQRIVNNGDVKVRVVPVHANQVMISIVVNTDPTSKNGLSPGEPLQLSLIYDTLENSTFFILDNNLEKSSR
jgi:hypothetical protein